MTATPLVIVIVAFGLLFVVTAALAQGLSSTGQSLGQPLRAHQQLNVMLLISNFIMLPAILIGLAAVIPFDKQVKMAIIALALCAGAPFIPWLVSLAKGNIAYSAAADVPADPGHSHRHAPGHAGPVSACTRARRPRSGSSPIRCSCSS